MLFKNVNYTLKEKFKMSQIAEKRVKELGYSEDPFNSQEFTANDIFDCGVECYDQAMQDFMEKAEMYLRYRVFYNTHPNNINVAIEDFKKYMQDEN